MLRRSWPVLIALLLVLLFLWWVRPIFHGLAMFFYTSPIVWLPPIAILAIGFGIRRFRRLQAEQARPRAADRQGG